MKIYLNLLLSIFAVAIFLNIRTFAQSPDNTFGTNGKAYTSFGSFSSYCHAMILLPDGKIISAGENGNTTQAILISKHNADGTLDISFNTTGKKQIDFGSAYEYCYSVLLHSDNKILLAGSSNGNAALARLLPNGDYDTQFSEDGKVTMSFGPGNGSSFQKVLQQPDGKIIAIGEAYNTSSFDFSAARFNTDGSIDPTFGDGGKTTVNFNNYNDFGRNATMQNDGKILIAGAAKNSNGNSSIALLRLNADGSPDGTFGTAGKTTLTISGIADDYAEEVILLANGKILVGGYTAGDFLVMRFNSNGTPDQTFGISGYTLTDFNNFQDKAYALDVDNNGSIYLGGHGYETGNGGLFHFAIAKYNSEGNLDNTFNTDGKMTVVMGAYQSTIFEMALQPDGKLLAGGQSTNIAGGFAEFALLRLEYLNVGITENELTENYVTAYPNPATDIITLSFSDKQASEPYEFTICDPKGQIVQNGSGNTTEIKKQVDVSGLSNGIHYLKVNFPSFSQTLKFTRIK